MRRQGETAMRHRLGFALALCLLAAPAFSTPDNAIAIELNSIETVQTGCRIAFLVENSGAAQIDSLKLDLAIFNREGVVQRRLVTEMGPIRKAKTIVRTFELDGECGQIGSILVNDVTACVPGDAGACLERLNLSSRSTGIRLYK
jgi:hypothetical protein